MTEPTRPVTTVGQPTALSGEPDSMTTAAKESAEEIVTSSKEHAGEVVDEAKSRVHKLAGDARTQLRQQSESQTIKLADTVASLSSELHSMASAAPHPDDAAATAVREVGDRAGQFADRLRREGVDGMVDDVKRFARQRPGLFLAGALVAGFVTGRLLRSADTEALVNAARADSSDGVGVGAPTTQVPRTEPEQPSTMVNPAAPNPGLGVNRPGPASP